MPKAKDYNLSDEMSKTIRDVKVTELVRGDQIFLPRQRVTFEGKYKIKRNKYDARVSARDDLVVVVFLDGYQKQRYEWIVSKHDLVTMEVPTWWFRIKQWFTNGRDKTKGSALSVANKGK